MVTLELVVKDSRGNHIKGLKAADFEIFEETPSRGREKRQQNIATFREVRSAVLTTRSVKGAQVASGNYSSQIASHEDSAPLTVLLVDGLNSDPQSQAQVHVQMLQMLRSLPARVPVAVYLLGNRLHLVQNFTTDPKLLQAALKNLVTPAGTGLATTDPRDDLHSLGSQLDSAGVPVDPVVLEHVKEFDQTVFAAGLDVRVNRTIDALESIGVQLAKSPRRKNLLWISTAFPIALVPSGNAGQRNYWAQLQVVNRVLGDAKIAVYPINPAGVVGLHIFDAAAPSGVYRPTEAMDAQERDTIARDELARGNEQDTMQAIAEGTGGKICTGDNKLADCIAKAVDDGSDYYEIAYYPDSQNWNGEYRRIIIKTGRRGAKLAYRQGYFATPLRGPGPNDLGRDHH